MIIETRRIGTIPKNNELQKALARGIIPIKFCYPEEGGDRWDELRQETGYTLGNREYATLIHALSRIGLTHPTNIIHLGIGNGIEIPVLVRTFDFSTHRYVGVDISLKMIDNTWRYHSAELKQMCSSYFVLSDIENEGNLEKICDNAKKSGHRRNLLLIMGQGVLLSNPEFFRYVSGCLQKEDYVLITLEGDDKSRRKEILRTYNLKPTHDLLKVGLARAGILEGTFLPAQFNEDLHRVELYFRDQKSRDVLCLTSYKPGSFNEFKETLEQRGLNPISIEYLPQTHTYAAICKGGKNV